MEKSGEETQGTQGQGLILFDKESPDISIMLQVVSLIFTPSPHIHKN